MRKINLFAVVMYGLYCSSSWADPGIYEANNPISIRKSSPALIAAVVMGAEGYGGYKPKPLWSIDLLTQCKIETKLYRPTPDPSLSAWPNLCDPQGMSSAINKDPDMHGAWSVRLFGPLQQSDAIYEMLVALSIGSPAVIPVYGDPAHWVTVRKLELTYEPTGPDIPRAWIYDALVGSGAFPSGEFELSGRNALARVFESMWTAEGDPYHKRYVVAHDPPPPRPIPVSLPGPPLPTRSEFASSWAAVVRERGGGVVTEETVLQRLQDAADTAEPGGSPTLRWALSRGAPERPIRVQGFTGAGVERDYFLVPIRAHEARELVVAMVEVDGGDGTLRSVFRPEQPFAYSPISASRAWEAAQGLLHPGEQLHGQRLTWHTGLRGMSMSWPVQPFYEAEIRDQRGRPVGYSVVALHDAGNVSRLPLDYHRDPPASP